MFTALRSQKILLCKLKICNAIKETTSSMEVKKYYNAHIKWYLSSWIRKHCQKLHKACHLHYDNLVGNFVQQKITTIFLMQFIKLKFLHIFIQRKDMWKFHIITNAPLSTFNSLKKEYTSLFLNWYHLLKRYNIDISWTSIQGLWLIS